ncbi:MAG TPA: dockerin type I domain-containing protein, partial [Chthoniobacterales bacterium]
SSSIVSSITLQPDGKVLAGGAFTSIGGQARSYIARLDRTTGAADLFNPDANSGVFSVAVQSDGEVLAGGQFTGVGGHARNRIARLDATTGVADAFDPNANSDVVSLAVQSDGKVLAGGTFTGIDGQARSLFARLSNDRPALSALAVTKAKITLTRNGSAAQFTHLTFEQSLDNGATYSLLGNGTPSASSYTLTGLNLPSGQNILIRARGTFRSGAHNGSESIEEKVQLAYLVPPLPTQVVSRRLHDGRPFDINLPLTGNLGVECRSGGATNDYQVVFTFPSAVSFTGASVTGAGSVTSSSGSGTTTATVNLTGVRSAQTIIVTLIGVNDLGNVDVPMGVLIGDANGDRSVNSGDAAITRNRSGQQTDASNFRSDYNLDGTINSGDATIVRSRSGSALP